MPVPREAPIVPMAAGLAAALGGMALLPGPAAAQVDLVFGAALKRGTLQTPYFFECSGDGTAGAAGLAPYAGLGIRGLSLTAEYVDIGDTDTSLLCIPPDPLPDGTHLAREYPRRSTHIWGWAFQLRYAPGDLPAAAYVGTGFESEGNEFVLIGAELRSRSRTSVFAGGEIMQIRTPYITNEETWQDGRDVSTRQVGEGHTWRKVLTFRLGLEYRWGLTEPD